ncbi:MAG: ABC transporter permease [Candidatus Bathyarchaeia archaeon]
MASMRAKFSSPLYNFFKRKIIVYVATFYLALTFVWLLPHLMPGDPVREKALKIIAAGAKGGGTSVPGLTEVQVKRLYEYWVKEFGLDQPPIIQYLTFLKNCLTFNLGVSIRFYPTRVSDLLMQSLPWSLALLMPAIIVGWILGNYLGALAAYRRGIFDKILYPLSLFASQMPYYWLALALIYVLSFHAGIFPPGGAYTKTLNPSLSLTFILDLLKHYALPFISVTIPYIGGEAVGMRSLLIYEINSEYINYSESLGFSDKKLLSYAFKNAMLPQITGLPIYFASAFGGQLVTEVVFGYPGIGALLYSAVIGQDYPLIQGGFLMIVTVTIIGNFLMDVFYAWIDPRIRITYRGEK